MLRLLIVATTAFFLVSTLQGGESIASKLDTYKGATVDGLEFSYGLLSRADDKGIYAVSLTVANTTSREIEFKHVADPSIFFITFIIDSEGRRVNRPQIIPKHGADIPTITEHVKVGDRKTFWFPMKDLFEAPIDFKGGSFSIYSSPSFVDLTDQMESRAKDAFSKKNVYITKKSLITPLTSLPAL